MNAPRPLTRQNRITDFKRIFRWHGFTIKLDQASTLKQSKPHYNPATNTPKQDHGFLRGFSDGTDLNWFKRGRLNLADIEPPGSSMLE
jgi:hypothetical protein